MFFDKESTMTLHRLAGQPAPQSMLVNIPALVSDYYTLDAEGPVSFGTSGHRGSALKGTFNEMQVASMAQAICDFRSERGRTGPLFMGFDTHALSVPAFRTALEVFAANGVETVIHEKDEFTPTPVISSLIVAHNRDSKKPPADGVVITPSHNPPRDGGFKYNPPMGVPPTLRKPAGSRIGPTASWGRKKPISIGFPTKRPVPHPPPTRKTLSRLLLRPLTGWST
jgi:phosphoglucomutase